MEKAIKAFGKLENRGIILKTHVSVYLSCILTVLLYSSEILTRYRCRIKDLERFHQDCFGKILNIKRQSLTSDAIVLQRTKHPVLKC